jgi:hypothetical protein
MSFSEMWFVGIASILIMCVVLSVIDTVAKLCAHLHRTYVLAHCDEFEYKEDCV